MKKSARTDGLSVDEEKEAPLVGMFIVEQEAVNQWDYRDFGGNLPVRHNRKGPTKTAGDCRTEWAGWLILL